MRNMFIKLFNFLFVLSLIMAISGVEGISDASKQDGPRIEAIKGPTIEATHKDRPSGATYHDVLLYDGKESNAYQLVVIGDSIAWGNGLKEPDKYYYQVAEDLRETLKRPVEITVYAHSGAKISAFGISVEEMTYKISGTLPDANVNRDGPTLMEQAEKISKDADLILVSGGINDVGALRQINPNSPIGDKSYKNIKEDMTDLLTKILDNTKADAKIVVTGYYPIISHDTTIEPQDKAVTSFSQIGDVAKTALQSVLSFPIPGAKEPAKIVENNKNLKEEAAENSEAFYRDSKTSLQGAVDDANKADGRSRIVFVDPKFESTSCYGASDSFLWELNSDGTSNDDLRFKRADIARSEEGLAFTYVDTINAIGHPNKKGASQYKDAIMGTILDDSKGLGIDWLTGEAPDPISRVYAAIIGEPADEPTYTSQIPVGDTQTKKFSTSNLPPEKVALSIDIRDKNGNTVPVGTKVTVKDGSGEYIQVDWSSIGNTLAFGAPGYWIITVDAPGYKTNTQYIEVSGASSSTSFRMNLLEKGINIQPPASQLLSSSKLAQAGVGTPMLPSPTSEDYSNSNPPAVTHPGVITVVNRPEGYPPGGNSGWVPCV